jgi:pimeloyl-ACP methyl ester carboxylesterase
MRLEDETTDETSRPHEEDAMPATISNGVKLAYDERGSGSPAFVFIHGWTCNRSFFAPQVEHFANRHRVISVDLRGHGESDKPQAHIPSASTLPTLRI